jgi:hypothetical protein
MLTANAFLGRYRLGTIDAISVDEQDQFVHRMTLKFGSIQTRREVIRPEKLGKARQSYLFDEHDLPYIEFEYGVPPDPLPKFAEQSRAERSKAKPPTLQPGDSMGLLTDVIDLCRANDGVIDAQELSRLRDLGRRLGLDAEDVEKQIKMRLAQSTPVVTTAVPASAAPNPLPAPVAMAQTSSPPVSATSAVEGVPVAAESPAVAEAATDPDDAHAWHSEAIAFLARVRTLVQAEALPFTPAHVAGDGEIGAELPRWASIWWSTSPIHYFGVAVGRKWRHLLTLTFGFYSFRESRDPLFRQAVDLLEQHPELAPEGRCVIAGRRYRWDDSEHLSFDSPIRITSEMLGVPELAANTAKDFVAFINDVWPVVAPIEASATADTRWRDAALKAHETRRRLAKDKKQEP